MRCSTAALLALLACSRDAELTTGDQSIIAPAMPEPLVLPANPVITATSSGYLPASWDVTPAGQLAYTIPLDVPAGRAGMEPALALTYSSGRGNGVVGVGWALAGDSAIARCPRTIAADGAVDGVDYLDDEPVAERDRLCLDGARLVALDAAATEFRTAPESYAKIVRASQTELTVYLRDGRIRTYRAAKATRWSADKLRLTFDRKIDERWPLAEERDRSGNTVRYVRQSISDGNGGTQLVLTAIEYTSLPTQPAYRRVEFEYEGRKDPEFAWRAGVRTSLIRRLATITMFAPDPGPTQPVWRYRLSYDESASTGRSLLMSVTKCGVLPSGADTGCLNSKRFEWYGTTGTHFTKAAVYTAPQLSQPYAFPVRNPLIQVLDVDADGADDVLFQPGNLETTMLINSQTANGTFAPLGAQWTLGGNGSSIPSDQFLEFVLPVDLDGNGSSELHVSSLEWVNGDAQCHTHVARWAGDHFADVSTGSPGMCWRRDRTMFADLDGNARLDVIGGGGTAWLDVSRNVGGSYQPEGTVDAGGDLYVTDLDGDGRAELLVDGATDGSETAQPHVELARRNDAGVYEILEGDDLPGGLPFACAGNQRVRPLIFADFNGDGLADVLDQCDPASGDPTLISIQWNTGNGFGPRISVDGSAAGIGFGHLFTKIRAGDVDRDGRADLVVFHQLPTNGITILRSRGNGLFDPLQLVGPAGAWIDWSFTTDWPGDAFRDPFPLSKLGDFNGDGFLDIVRVVVAPDQTATVEALYQDAHHADRIMSFSDGGTLWPRERVTYDSRWADDPPAREPCSYPLHCIRRGLTVVRRVESRAHLVDTNPVAERSLFYSYSDPVADMQGRGFLGFATFAIWDPVRPMETVLSFDNRSLIESGAWPSSGAPTKLRTAIGLSPVSDKPKAEGTVAMTARVTVTHYTRELVALNGGATYDDRPKSWASLDWEQPITIDWGPAYRHMTTIDGPTDGVLRWRTGSTTYDDHGNETRRAEGTAGLRSTEVETTYLPPTADWLIARADRRCTTSHGDGPSVTACDRYGYGSSGLLTSITRDDPDPAFATTTTIHYDGWGMPTTIERTADAHLDGSTDARRIHIEYDARWPGQPDEHVFPSQIWHDHTPSTHRPSTWIAVHPALGVVSAWMDANGVQGQAVHDALGRVRTHIVDGQPDASFGYGNRPDTFGGGNGTIVTRTQAGTESTVVSDALGRTIETSRPAFDGTATRIATRYDTLGRVRSVSRPFWVVPAWFTTAMYDPLDRVLQVEAPDTSMTYYTHAFGESRRIDAANRDTITRYDEDGRIVESTTMDNTTPVTTTYRYDVLGGVTEVAAPGGHTVVTVLDRIGRTIRKEDPSLGVLELDYDGFDEIIARRHLGSAELTSYRYDDLGRVIAMTEPSGAATELTWDTQPYGIGRLATSTTSDGVSTLQHYDAQGRPIGVDQTVGGEVFRMSWSFDNLGRLFELRYPPAGGGSWPGLIVRHSYNAAGHLRQLHDATTVTPALLWQVDGRNRDDSLTAGRFGNGFTVARAYEALFGRLKTSRVKDGATSVFDLAYTYEPTGLVETRDDAVGGSHELFTYDEHARLETWTIGTVATRYEYEPTGNLTRVLRNNVLVEHSAYGNPDGSAPYAVTAHTAGGTTTAYGYDGHGRQVSGGGRTLGDYTAFGLPRTIAVGDEVTMVRYSAFGERAAKQAPGAATVYIGKLYERRTTGTKTSHAFRIYGPDGPVGEVVQNPLGVRTTSYFATDLLGSLNATIASGGAVDRQIFDPWGKRAVPVGSTANRLGFTGHEHDDEGGLINMMGRLYDPRLRRMLAVDPIIGQPASGQSWNAYSYARNSPTSFVDRNGYDATMYDDCTYFTDACGNDIGALAGDPIGATASLGEAGIDHGTGALGWAFQSPGGAGYGGIPQSTFDGYGEFGSAALDPVPVPVGGASEQGRDIVCGQPGNPPCLTPDTARLRTEIQQQADKVVRHFGTLRSPRDLTNSNIRILATTTAENTMRLEHTAAVIYNNVTRQVRLSPVFVGGLHQTQVDFDKLVKDGDLDHEAGDRIIGIVHTHPALNSGFFSGVDVDNANRFAPDNEAWVDPEIGFTSYLLHALTPTAFATDKKGNLIPDSYGGYQLFDVRQNRIGPVPR